ncbi:MAG: type IV toxin-antitoxin system AbiEi family antitoxin [Anaerolineae bacterium]
MTRDTLRRRALSSLDATLLSTLSGQGKDVFNTQTAASVLGQPSTVVRKRLHNLVKKGWLRRLEKGKYLIVPLSAGPEGEYVPDELVVAAHLVQPYYISYWTALRYYGYTEQAGSTVYVVTARRKRRLAVGGVVYRFITVNEQKFFGTRRVWIDGVAVQMAEREKALTDCLDRPDLCGGIVEAAKAVWRGREEMDWEKARSYAQRMGNRTILKRLGFLLELYDLGTPSLLEAMRSEISAGYSALDTLYPHEGRHDSGWGLIVNVAEGDLLAWRET